MKLHCHTLSPFARKAMILNRLKGLNVQEIMATPDGARGYTNGVNPLGKIPVLELNNGLPALFDSGVICEYLDSLKAPLLPASGPERWTQLRLHALGDGLSDAVYNYRYETVRPNELHWTKIIERHTKALEMGVEALSAEIGTLGTPWTFGNLSVVCALDYMSFRAPHIDWRKRSPDLEIWHNQFVDFPVYRETFGYSEA